MQRSESVADLMAALSKAQGEMKPAIKNKTNPHFRGKYADLSGIFDVLREPFAKHGLAVTQMNEFNAGTEGGWVVWTTVWKGDQYLSHATPLLAVGKTSQNFGAAETYARRQGLQTLLGVAADEDDDGNEASGKEPEPKGNQKPPVQQQQNKNPGPVPSSQPPRTEGAAAAPGAPGAPAPSNPPKSEITQADWDKLVAMVNDKSRFNPWTMDELGEYMEAKYKKKRLGQYTRKECDELIETVHCLSFVQAMELVVAGQQLEGKAQ